MNLKQNKPMQMLKKELKDLSIINLFLLTAAGTINAFGVSLFLFPVKLYDSGISGLSMLLDQVTPPTLNLSLFLILLNFPIFVFGLRKQGPVFTVYSLFTIAVYSLVSYLIMHVLPINVNFVSPLAGTDLLLCAVFGGVISGIGSGLTIRFGGAIDGLDVLSVIFAKRIGISIGTFVMAFNILLYIICGIAIKSWILPLYSVVTYAAASKTIDFFVEGFDRSKTGIQSVTARVSLTETDEETDSSVKSVGYSFIQDATVQMVKSTAPQLKLKADKVTVNNSDAWNASSYISYINDDSGILPALIVEGNVDMETDGDYNVTYTAIDIEGNKTTAKLKVSVRTPEEVIKAREEAERIAAEEAAAEAARLEQERLEKEEAERRAAEEAAELERLAQLEAAAQTAETGETYTEGSGYQVTGSSDNPYYGGWSNCVYGAWQLAHDLSGVNLPSWGYAGTWLYSAQASGYATGSAPAAGSIAVYSGHVAYVSAVNGDQVYIMEGGYNGGYNERWVNKDYIYGQSLVGYIYLP